MPRQRYRRAENQPDEVQAAVVEGIAEAIENGLGG